MGYQLRMHSEIHDRLTDLRSDEPELARLVGEAVLALLDAGESLGPPLVVPLESVLQPPESVREAFALTGTEIRDLTPPFPVGPGPDESGIHPPPGLMELRPGAPGHVRAGLLFAVEPADTAVLVAWVDDPGSPPDRYRDVIELAAGRLPPASAPSSADFISYNAESLLDEFFPGEETEVEIGAGALVARDRAHTLAAARQRMRLTQAQVAQRMNVRQERVSAIERAEPGATEVRTLAAYVAALGGRLEIVAHIGDERITLR